MLTYEPGYFDSEPPTFFFITGRYQFILYTGEAIAGFVRTLPQVAKTFGSDDSTLWVVTLASACAYDLTSAQRAYRGVLASIHAHLDPPLSEQWERAIEGALLQEPPIDDEATKPFPPIQDLPF